MLLELANILSLTSLTDVGERSLLSPESELLTRGRGSLNLRPEFCRATFGVMTLFLLLSLSVVPPESAEPDLQTHTHETHLPKKYSYSQNLSPKDSNVHHKMCSLFFQAMMMNDLPHLQQVHNNSDNYTATYSNKERKKTDVNFKKHILNNYSDQLLTGKQRFPQNKTSIIKKMKTLNDTILHKWSIFTNSNGTLPSIAY